MNQGLQVTHRGSFCEMAWENLGLTVTVDRMRNHSDGRISAEVSFKTGVNGHSQHLYSAHMTNLLGTNIKRDLAKEMQAIWPSTLEWSQMVELIVAVAVKEFRAGEPIKKLGGTPAIPDLAWRLHPVLLDAKPTLIFADGGSGKSLLALLFAILIQRDFRYAGLVPKQGNVLYCDWETDFEEQERRMAQLQAGLMLNSEASITYRRCRASLVDDIAAIQAIVAREHISYIVIDSISGAAGANIETQETTAQFFGALSSLGIGSLLISHVAKNGLGEGKTPFGSAYWRNYARSVYELRHRISPEPNRVSLGLFHRKMNTGRLGAPIGFSVEFTDEAITFDREDIKDVDAFLGELTQSQQIWFFLERGAKTAKEIALYLSDLSGKVIADGGVRTVLSRMTNVVKLPDERWGRKE